MRRMYEAAGLEPFYWPDESTDQYMNTLELVQRRMESTKTELSLRA